MKDGGCMNYFKDIKYFTPTVELKELVILDHIEKNENITQKELAEIANCAPSMVNVYINEYENKGYIVREYLSSKTVKYKITKKGIRKKNYLLITYLHELLKLYKLAKENIEKFLVSLEDRGYRDIFLYGAGEVASTILSVVRDKGNLKLNILGLIDDDIKKQGSKIMGYAIISLNDAVKKPHDAIVITTYTYEDKIKSRLQEIGYNSRKVVGFFG